MLQWPVLCGRMASSFTTMRPSRASISSTARMPTTPSSWAIRSAIACRSRTWSARSSGAGVVVATQMPSVCTVSLTGYTTACPPGRRATSTLSSRLKSMNSSAMTTASARQALAARRTGFPPARDRPASTRPCRRSRRGRSWRCTGQPCSSAKATSAPRPAPPGWPGTGTPSPASRSRITALSWACTRASGPGPDGDAVSLQVVQDLRGHVLMVEGHHVAAGGEGAHRRRVGVVADHHVVHDLRGGDVGPSASSRSRRPSPMDAACIIRASWPPPITPTVAAGVLTRASLGRSATGAAAARGTTDPVAERP